MAGKLLNNYRGAVLMVTHDRYFLDRVTNRIFELSFENCMNTKETMKRM